MLNILIGVFLSLGIVNIIIGFSGRQLKPSIILASLSFLVLAYLFGQKIAYSAVTPEGYLFAHKYNLCVLSLIGVAFSWFIHTYIQGKHLWQPILVSSSFILLLIVNCLSQTGALYKEITDIDRIIFPWGEGYSIPLGDYKKSFVLLDLAIILFIAHLFYALYTLKRKKKKAISWIWAILIFIIIAAVLNDYCIAKRWIRSIYTLEFALAIFMVVISILMIAETYHELIMLDKMKEKLHFMESLVDNIDLVVVGLNRMGNVEYVNPYYLEITGYEPDEVMGKDWFANFIPQSTTYDTQGFFLELLKNDFEPLYENPIILKDGTMLPISWHNVRLVDLDGKVYGSFSIGVPGKRVKS